MVFYIVIMGIIDLSVSWMQIGQDLRNTEGLLRFTVFIGGNLVSWKSKKRSVVSRCSAESKYRVMTQSACESMWLHQLLAEVGIKTSFRQSFAVTTRLPFILPLILFFHERSKRIEIDCHFVLEKIQLGLISIGYVKTGEQLGDIITKALSKTGLDTLCNKLGMINIYAPT